MTSNLDGMRVAFVVANEGVEQSELSEPWEAVQEAGGRPQLVAPEPGEVHAVVHHQPGDHFPVDWTTVEVMAGDIDAVVLPGVFADSRSPSTVVG